MTAQSVARWDKERSGALDKLVEELHAILETAPRSVRSRFVLPQPGSTAPDKIARFLYDQRRMRSRAFKGHAKLFAEPAWDLLLDLFIAESDGRLVSASSASIGACAPQTTTLRCIKALR